MALYHISLVAITVIFRSISLSPHLLYTFSYENICQYAKSLWRFPQQSRLLDVSLSPIRNVGRLCSEAWLTTCILWSILAGVQPTRRTQGAWSGPHSPADGTFKLLLESIRSSRQLCILWNRLFMTLCLRWKLHIGKCLFINFGKRPVRFIHLL